ncbi:MAG: hypothetical protein WDW38_009231 [Sanguina aurantia]
MHRLCLLSRLTSKCVHPTERPLWSLSHTPENHTPSITPITLFSGPPGCRHLDCPNLVSLSMESCSGEALASWTDYHDHPPPFHPPPTTWRCTPLRSIGHTTPSTTVVHATAHTRTAAPPTPPRHLNQAAALLRHAACSRLATARCVSIPLALLLAPQSPPSAALHPRSLRKAPPAKEPRMMMRMSLSLL